MRIKHFFGLAVLAAMTASCSSNNDLVNGGNGSGENESGVSYASFSITLPTTSGTRADDTPSGSPSFANGDKNEYKVNDATLLIFKRGGKQRKKVSILSLRVLSWVQWHHGKSQIQMRQV